MAQRSAEYEQEKGKVVASLEENKAALGVDYWIAANYLAMAQLILTTETDAYGWLHRITTLIEKL